MYGKIFVSMYDGSMHGHWQAIVTLQQMVVLADPEGILDMTPEALSARTSIPLDIITPGIAELEQPDPKSRTPDDDGRRIVRLDSSRDWGWRIVNYISYRKIRSAEERREYMRQYQRVRRSVRPKAASTVSTAGKQVLAKSTNSSRQKEKKTIKTMGESVPFDALWAVYIEELGGNPPHPSLTDGRRRVIGALYREHLQHAADPSESFRAILRRVKASDFHMGKRAYQLPESLFRNEDRRDRWANGHVGGNGQGSGDLPPALRNEPRLLEPEEELA